MSPLAQDKEVSSSLPGRDPMLAREAGRPALDSWGDLDIGDDGPADQENPEGKPGKEIKMTYEKAKQTQQHNPEAVMKVLEGLEWKCPECKGSGIDGIENVELGIPEGCFVCKGEGNLHYSWIPEFGQMVIYKKKVALITGVNPLKEKGQYDILLQISPLGIIPEIRAKIEDVTVILDWQEIERVLEKTAHELRLRAKHYNFDGMGAVCRPSIQWIIGKSRQEAVMKAVLVLGKEIK